MGSEGGAIKLQHNVSVALPFRKASDWQHLSKLLSSRMVWNILEELILQIARQAVRQETCQQ